MRCTKPSIKIPSFILLIFSVLLPSLVLGSPLSKRVVPLLESYVTSHIEEADAAYEVRVIDVNRIQKVDEATSVVRHFIRQPESRRFKASVIIKDKQEMVLVEVVGRLEPVYQVPMVSHRLKKGEEITREDMQFQRWNRPLPKGVIMDIDELVGLTPVRSIMPGKPITKHQVKPKDIITKGQSITLLYDNAQLRVQTLGVALDSGAKGAVIRVKNVKSGKIVRAVVFDDATAKVNL